MSDSGEFPGRILFLSIKRALIGHYTTAILTVPLMTVAFWMLDRWVLDTGLTLAWHFVTALVGVFVTQTALTFVERPFVVKHDHPDPGDWAMTVLMLLTPLPCWAVVLWLLHGASAWTGAAAIIATGVYALLTVLIVEPWKEGNDRAEVRRKIREMNERARDL